LILIAGTSYGSKYFGSRGSHTVAFVMSFATTMLLWRIYTCRAGEVVPAAVAAVPDRNRLVRTALMAHLLMVVGIVATSAGFGLVIDRPLGHTLPAWLTFVLAGPALFLAGRAIFEHTVLTHTVRDRQIGVLVLLVLAPATLFVTPLAVAATVMGS
jgi:low temperature requirement protein LtrA